RPQTIARFAAARSLALIELANTSPILVPSATTAWLDTFPYTTLFRSKDTKELAFKVTTDLASPPGAHRNVFCQVVEDVSMRPRRSEEHTSEIQSPCKLVCRLLLGKKMSSGRVRCR